MISILVKAAATCLETSSPAFTTTVSLETTIFPLSILAGTPICCKSPRNGPGGNPVSPAGTTISSGAVAPAFAGADVLLSSNILYNLKGFMSVHTSAG